jgi:hypothetical protein
MRLLIGILILATSMAAWGQDAAKQTSPKKSVPKYNPAAEAVYKGTVDNVSDHECPVSGGMGSHVMLKLDGGTIIEVHLASVEFTKLVEVNLQKGDAVEVTGWKTQLDGVDAIFARELRHGTDVYTFRTKDGKPAW